MPDSVNTTNYGTNRVPPDEGFPDNPKRGYSDYTRFYETERLNRGPVTALAGNIADMQRLGAQLAMDKSSVIPTGEEIGPTSDKEGKKFVTPAEFDAAKGEYTIGSARAGLVDAPPTPIPGVGSPSRGKSSLSLMTPRRTEARAGHAASR